MGGRKGQEDSADVKDCEVVRTHFSFEHRSAPAVLQNDMPLWASKQSAPFLIDTFSKKYHPLITPSKIRAQSSTVASGKSWHGFGARDKNIKWQIDNHNRERNL